MFIMQIPSEAEELIQQLEITYPRAAKTIRTFWGAEEDCREAITSILSDTSGKNRAGFSFEGVKLISEIQEKYLTQLEEFKMINKSKDEVQIIEQEKNDIWARPEFKN